MDERSQARRNLLHFFHERCRRFRGRKALLYKKQKRYHAITWDAWADSVKKTALGLSRLGVGKGDRVAILSENRPEWTFADLGILSVGGITVPIYPTAAVCDIAFILKDAGVEFLFISSKEQFQRIFPVLSEYGRIRSPIFFDAVPDQPEGVAAVSLNALTADGAEMMRESPDSYDRLIEKVQPDDIASIIYTSGTTGSAKGVMLSHGNFVSNIVGATAYVPVSEKDTMLSYLPLSHVFERMAGYYFMIFHGATIAYAESMQTLPEDFRLVRPTVMTSVPRLFEKTQARISETVAASPAWRRKIYDWGVRTGRACAACRLSGKKVPWTLAFRRAVADAVVFQKLKKQLGGRLRFFISGGAPLSKALAEYFYAVDVLILEGYGLTETSPVIAVNAPWNFRFGTVGKPLPNLKVAVAEDGEIMVSGPSVMAGYYRNEDASRAVIRDGWLYTGDIGSLDSGGFLTITDRKKDIIVTSNGKNISPQNIENLILADPVFVQAVVVGDKRNYLVALLVPNRTEVERYAAGAGLKPMPWEALLKDGKIQSWLRDRLNEKTRCLASYEQIKYFHPLARELSHADGELTPTLKVKRKVVIARYARLIDALYQQHARPESKP